MLSCFSRIRLFATLWTVACQAPLSMEFSRQEYWSGLPFPSPGHLPNPGIKPVSLMSPALAGGFLPPVPAGKHCGGADVDLQGDLPQRVADTCLPGLLLLVPVPVAGH